MRSWTRSLETRTVWTEVGGLEEGGKETGLLPSPGAGTWESVCVRVCVFSCYSVTGVHHLSLSLSPPSLYLSD